MGNVFIHTTFNKVSVLYYPTQLCMLLTPYVDPNPIGFVMGNGYLWFVIQIRLSIYILLPPYYIIYNESKIIIEHINFGINQ